MIILFRNKTEQGNKNGIISLMDVFYLPRGQ